MTCCARGRRARACPTLGARAAAAALLVLSVALAAADEEKRAEMSPMPFVMGSRYGRSSGPRLIAPRNDRFFMGSRYGKRSEALSGAVHGEAVGGGGGGGDGVRAEGGRALVCEYTGVFPLYRCVKHYRRPHYDKRGSEEEIAGERE